jgi:hypothetical protein
MIIGLSGYARSGKDEAAIALQQLGFHRVAFADKLREVLYQLNPLVSPTPEGYFVSPKTPMRLQDVIGEWGWGGYKESVHSDEIRRLLQRLGTEAGRQTLWDSIWVDAAFAGAPEGLTIVVTDCRFPNEAQAIKDKGGEVWRIEREGVGPANSHASETGLDDWKFDVVIGNDGTLEDYHGIVREIAKTRLV